MLPHQKMLPKDAPRGGLAELLNLRRSSFLATKPPETTLQDPSPSSLLPLGSYNDRVPGRFISVHAGMDQSPSHHRTPFANAALQGPQLSRGELAGVLPLQAFDQ